MGRRGDPPEFRGEVLDLVEPDGRSLRSPRREDQRPVDLQLASPGPHRQRADSSSEQPREVGTGGGAPPDRLAGDRAGQHAPCRRAAHRARAPVFDGSRPSRCWPPRVPVQVCCWVLAVSPSGCSAWRNRAPSARAIRHAWLTDAIGQVRAASHQSDGQPAGPCRAHLGRGAASATTPWSCRLRRAGLQASPAAPRSAAGCGPRPPPTTWSSGGSLAAVTSSGDRHRASTHPRRQAGRCRGAGCLLASAGRLVDRRHPNRSPGDNALGWRSGPAGRLRGR